MLGVYLGLTGPAADLARLLDGLEDGFLLCDHSGYLLHQTPTLAQMLNDEPERKRLQGTIQGILHSLIELFSHSGERAVGTPAQVSRGIRTARASYRVYGTNVRHGITQQGLAPPGVTLVIRVEYIRPRPPSDQALQRCFGLTVREVEVARLLARCWSRGEIARYLRVSPHTVARHSEHVFTKIGVHSRAQLRARLAGEHPDKMLNQ